MKLIYDAFWRWFAENDESCLQLLTTDIENPAFTGAEFEAIFRQYCGKGLYANLEWANQDSLPRIIITTHGNYRYFQQAEALVAAAPLTLPWDVMAFEPPRPANFLIREQFNHLAFDAADLFFLPLELYKDFSTIPPVITIYTDRKRRSSKTYQQATEQVIYNVLGEKSTVLDISGIALEPLSQLTEQQREETAPIDMLGEFIIDLSPPALVVDDAGKLQQTGFV